MFRYKSSWFWLIPLGLAYPLYATAQECRNGLGCVYPYDEETCECVTCAAYRSCPETIPDLSEDYIYYVKNGCPQTFHILYGCPTKECINPPGQDLYVVCSCQVFHGWDGIATSDPCCCEGASCDSGCDDCPNAAVTVQPGLLSPGHHWLSGQVECFYPGF